MTRPIPRHVAVHTGTGWADRVLDVRPAAAPLPAEIPTGFGDGSGPETDHQVGPGGWALSRWRGGNPDHRKMPTDVAVIHAPDGTRTAVVAESPEPVGSLVNLASVFLSLISTNAPRAFGAPLAEHTWPLLQPLHEALLRPDVWLRAAATPEEAWADARTLLAWAPYGAGPAEAASWTAQGVRDGRSLRAWQDLSVDDPVIARWAPHFSPADAAPWVGEVSDPSVARAWSRMRYVLPQPVAVGLHRLGWDPVRQQQGIERRMWWGTGPAEPTRLLDLATAAQPLGLTPEDVLLAYDAGLTGAEIEAAAGDEREDLMARVRFLVGLQRAGADAR